MRDVSANLQLKYLPRAMYEIPWRKIWNPTAARDLETWIALKCWPEERPWTSCWWWHCLFQWWVVHRVTPPRRQSPAGMGHATARQQQNPSVPSADGGGLSSSRTWKVRAQSAGVILATSVVSAREWGNHPPKSPVSLPCNAWITSSKLLGI